MILVVVFLTNFKPQLLITLNFKIMKQRILLLMYLAMLAIQGWAAPVDESSARAIVQDFVIAKRGITPNSMPTSSGSDLQLLHAEMSSVSVTQNAYYIYNTGDGFVIVAGDDRAEQILGYGDEELDMNDIPCGMQFLLDSYKEQIDYLFEHPGLVVETPSMNAPRLTATSVAPMLTAKFGQSVPFYNLTPVYNGKHCLTGCACVALCQVMHYYQYPTVNVPSVRAYTTRTLGISVHELPSDRFHWNYIKDSYKGSYTADEAYSVAKLMRYVGQAMEMDYTPSASGAAVFQIRDAAELFGYDYNARVLYKDLDNYTDAQWAALIQAELNAKRPVVYAAWDTTRTSKLVGHAFNIDGYNASNNKYHINWGWNGSNGYYALNAFNTSNYKFNVGPEMIIGLKPIASPEIVVMPTTLSLIAKLGETKTATFDVKGYALTGNLTVKLNNGGNIYSIDKTSITMSDAAYRTTITVTYKPTKIGTSNASVTISGGGATSKSISLNGTANPASTISVYPWSLSFNAATGETKTATFLVKCPNAISDLKLNLNNGGTIYSIDKTSISKSAAISGTNVTVTYKPTERGTSNASITISGGGANPQTVSLSGEATKPEITVTPTSLSFDAHSVETKTATINVKGYDLKGNLSLVLDDPEGVYAIDKTSLSKSEAINGTTVTVSYSPTKNGSSNASIIISGEGAETKTVNISGYATIPEITVEPDSLSLSTYVNNAVKQTFKVKGYNLTNDLSFAFSDNTSTYRIGSINTTISGSNFTSNVEVIYNPSVAGTNNSILTVSCGSAEPKTIMLTGVAEDLPNVNVDANSIAFESTYTGYQSSRTITITCPDLQKDLQLSLSNDNTNSFGLSKSTITPEAAAAGAPVTVYFGPTNGGGKHAKLNIWYDGYKVVTIPLSGVGIKSDGYITAWPVNLSFETQAGTPVTQTFRVSYSYPNGAIMISKVDGNGETCSDTGDNLNSAMPTLNAINNLSGLTKKIIPFDSVSWHRKELIGPFIGPIEPISIKSLVLELTGDDCFEITPSRISLRSIPCSTIVTVTYRPEYVGEHDATIKIKLSLGSAKPLIIPLHGSATNLLNAPSCENMGNDLSFMQNGTSVNTIVDELSMSSRVYANGLNIIIESPVEQSAIICDVAGHSRRVDLQAGRNEIPVNASGIYIVRIREKTTKLMLK